MPVHFEKGIIRNIQDSTLLTYASKTPRREEMYGSYFKTYDRWNFLATFHVRELNKLHNPSFYIKKTRQFFFFITYCLGAKDFSFVTFAHIQPFYYCRQVFAFQFDYLIYYQFRINRKTGPATIHNSFFCKWRKQTAHFAQFDVEMYVTRKYYK